MGMPDVVGQYLQLEHSGSVYKALCPFHKDSATKSFTVYEDDAYCFGCGIWLSPVTFLMKYLNITWRQAKEKLGDLPVVVLPKFRKPVVDPSIIPIDTIKTWHSMLKEHRDYFHSRLFTDETIDRELWGWSGDRYVLPVWGGPPGDRCISVRMRAGKKDMEPKYLGLKNFSPKVLYNVWNVEKYYQTWPEGLPKTVYLFFGEFDAALATQDGLPAVSPTNGQNAWLDQWDTFFEPYQIIIVPDKKEEMRGYQVASRFPGRASVVQWPVGDFSDYNSWRLAGGTPDQFLCDIVGSCVQPCYEIERFWEVECLTKVM